MYGVIDFSRIDTEPGAASAFASLAGFTGDYREFMRKRWTEDVGVRQHMAVLARRLRRGEKVDFVGCHALEAQAIAESMVDH